MDPILQAYTGLTVENKGEDGIPHRTPIIAIDMSTALYAYSAVSTALYARRDETRGRHIEASLMQAAAGLQVVRLMQSYLEGGAIRPPGAPSGVYQVADGWMTITVVRLHEWLGFCKAVGLTEFAADERLKRDAGPLRPRRRDQRQCCVRCSRRSRSRTGRNGWPPSASCTSS